MTSKSSAIRMLISMLLVAVVFLCTGFTCYNLLNYASFLPPVFMLPKLPPGTPALRVYFIGNSYTFVNDLPEMISAVAASDTVSPVDIQTGMHTKGGATLDELWQYEKPRQELQTGQWNYVVLQEQSMQTLHPEWVHIMHTAMTNWNREIRNAGAKPVVYETWARKPGSDWYDTGKYPGAGFIDPVYMQSQIDKVTNGFAEEIGAPVVPAGDRIAACRIEIGMPDFYNSDGTHPSLAGDYLIALLFYQSLTGHSIEHITYAPLLLSADDVQMIKKCASGGLN